MLRPIVLAASRLGIELIENVSKVFERVFQIWI